MKKQAGFTLIELIAVIVILGIIAAVAVPRFVDLSTAAQEAALSSVASSMESAMSLNYAGAVASNAGLTVNPASIDVNNCSDVASILSGGIPDGYTVEPAALDGLGTSADCTVTQTSSGTTATFTGIGTTDA